MNVMKNVLEHIGNSYENPVISGSTILSVLLMCFLLCAYEFWVYRLVSRRAFYNRSFNICISVLPFFIATIILCLQSNIVITLGTIGALAIIRFRTAIKDPVDMLYLLWSIHTGIMCGCQLYNIAILTSISVTIVLLIMENVSLGKKPYILVFHCPVDKDKEILDMIKTRTKKYRVKSRNYTNSEMIYVLELSIKDTGALMETLRETGIDKYSVIEYDSDDII